MQRIDRFIRDVSPHLIGRVVGAQYVATFHHLGAASFGPGQSDITFNKFRCGNAYFDAGLTDEVFGTVVHELAHDRVTDHLSNDFYKQLELLGAKLTRLALEKPEVFR